MGGTEATSSRMSPLPTAQTSSSLPGLACSPFKWRHVFPTL